METNKIAPIDGQHSTIVSTSEDQHIFIRDTLIRVPCFLNGQDIVPETT